MIKHYDVSYLKKELQPDGVMRATWTKIGVGFPGKDGSISVKLDALPLTVNSETRFALYPKEFEPKP